MSWSCAGQWPLALADENVEHTADMWWPNHLEQHILPHYFTCYFLMTSYHKTESSLLQIFSEQLSLTCWNLIPANVSDFDLFSAVIAMLLKALSIGVLTTDALSLKKNSAQREIVCTLKRMTISGIGFELWPFSPLMGESPWTVAMALYRKKLVILSWSIDLNMHFLSFFAKKIHILSTEQKRKDLNTLNHSFIVTRRWTFHHIKQKKCKIIKPYLKLNKCPVRPIHASF